MASPSTLNAAPTDAETDLTTQAKQYRANKRWGKYRNVRYEAAERMRRANSWRRALRLYVEVMIFDLQGVACNCDGEGFSRARRGEVPSVAREIARLALRKNLDADVLAHVYDQVANEFWVAAFPRSRPDVWEEIRVVTQNYRQSVQLKDRVEALGPDNLLSSEEANAYIQRTDDYDLLRRVITLLKDESPLEIPWEKRKRAQAYLSAIDIDELGNRWKAKAYRWAGEIMRSNEENEGALKYFERALELADRDDRVLVKYRAERLREELGR